MKKHEVFKHFEKFASEHCNECKDEFYKNALKRAFIAGWNAAILPNRQHEIMERIVEGKLYKEIAFDLGISIHTVEKHVQYIFKKFGFHNRTEAAVAWTRNTS